MPDDVKRVTRAFGEGMGFGLGSLLISVLVNAVIKKLQTQPQEATTT